MTTSEELPRITNIGIVGGGPFCKEVLEKTTFDYGDNRVDARILIIADPDPDSPGVQTASVLGMKTVRDYHALYAPKYRIDLIIGPTPAGLHEPDLTRSRGRGKGGGAWAVGGIRHHRRTWRHLSGGIGAV